MPPSITTHHPIIPLLPLHPSTFSPFGTVITSPLPQNVNSLPSTPPAPFTPANQNTALKASPISPFTDLYENASTETPGTPTISMFSCFPRVLEPSAKAPTLRINILERHPFTTQTFIPMGLSPEDTSTKYIVTVAPTLPPTTQFPTQGSGPPDLENIKAFVAHGRQAVTYGAGTWHAPMVVLGAKRVDFVVVQHVNGVSGDDCQEVEVKGDVRVVLEEGGRAMGAKL